MKEKTKNKCKNIKQKKVERNQSHKFRSQSLLKPTPVKNYKIRNERAESEEDVISEMRSLTVRPTGRVLNNKNRKVQNTARLKSREFKEENEVNIALINPKSKVKLLKWLESINLIRKSAVSVKEFPQFCRNGVIFFDLVNKLGGREQVLKGVHRNPKNVSSINANYSKVLTYMREFPKMNSRYLWSESLMMEGNNDVIWGFIEDLWYWHHNKISPSDKSKKSNSQKRKSLNKFKNTHSSFRSIGHEIKN